MRALAAGLVLLAASASPLRAADFIRGDANGDDVVSFSDAHSILAYIFRGDLPPSCLAAADADDNGQIDVADAIRLLGAHVLNGAPLPPPNASPGPDPTPDALGCDSYGGGSPIEDPGARLEVLDVTTLGGAETGVDIRIAISSSGPIAGYATSIRLPPGLLLKPSSRNYQDLTGTMSDRFLAVLYGDDVLRIAFIPSITYNESLPILAGQGIEVALLGVCLAPGALAGEYPLVVESAELADWESGRAVHPALESGTLTVLNDVEASAECDDGLPPPPPESINVEYRLGAASASRGGTATMPFIVRADAGVQGYMVSVDFDEEVLQAAPVAEFLVPDSSAVRFFHQHVDNENQNPGNRGVDEGFIIAAQVFSMGEGDIALPPDTDHEVLRFEFTVDPETSVPATQVRFLDGGQGSGQPVRNLVTALGVNYTPELADSFVFTDGVLNVLPDITLFIRGDANGDETVNLSDAETTLGWLFLGSPKPACLDAADSNDSGTVDITDPIHVLHFLFLGIGTIPQPYPEAGEDLTPDSMGCRSGS
jgi:hypothetical protein